MIPDARYYHGHSQWKLQERDARIANELQRPGRGSLTGATITVGQPAGWNEGLVAEAYDAGRRRGW